MRVHQPTRNSALVFLRWILVTTIVTGCYREASEEERFSIEDGPQDTQEMDTRKNLSSANGSRIEDQDDSDVSNGWFEVGGPDGSDEYIDQDEFEYSSILPIYRLYIEQQLWNELIGEPEADIEVRATLRHRSESYPIGVEIQGSSSRSYPKKSYKMKFGYGKLFGKNPFDDNRPSIPFETLILKAMYKDQSMIREAIAFDIWRLMDIPAPRNRLVVLFINDDYRGVYLLTERVDEGYLDRNRYPPGGNLYKAVRQHGDRADFFPGRDLTLAFEKKTNPDEAWGDLFDLVDRFHNTPCNESDFMERIDSIFPLEDFFYRMAWVSFTQNIDAVSQNFYLYNSSSVTKPFWHLIPWDSDICLSNHWSLDERRLAPEEKLLLDGGSYLGKQVFKIDGLKRRYLELFQETLTDVFTEEAIWAIISYYFDLVREELAKDLERWERNSSVNEEFGEIEDFFSERRELLRRAIERELDDLDS